MGKGLSQEKDCKQSEDAFVLDRDNAHGNYYNLKCALAVAEKEIDGYFQNEHVSKTLEDYQITSQGGGAAMEKHTLPPTVLDACTDLRYLSYAVSDFR